MRNSLHHFAAIAIVVGWTLGIRRTSGQQAALRQAGTILAPATAVAAPAAVSEATVQPSQGEVTDPVADPKAVVVMGKARFTVLTPQLIRMEWAADGKFEDHASFVFLNRRLPRAEFDRTKLEHGHKLIIKTSALTLHLYSGRARSHQDGRFTPENLTIELTVDGKPVIWHPGLAIDPQNLQGTTRTLDGALGDKTKEPIEQRARLALRLGGGGRLHAPALRLGRLQLQGRRKQPLAVGHRAPRRRPPGLVLLRLRPRLPQGAGRLRARGRPHPAAAALRLRRVVVALLGLQRPGDRGDRPRLPRERHAAGRVRHRHGLAHQPRAAGGRAARRTSRAQSLGWTGYTWNKMLFPDPDAVSRPSCTPTA